MTARRVQPRRLSDGWISPTDRPDRTHPAPAVARRPGVTRSTPIEGDQKPDWGPGKTAWSPSHEPVPGKRKNTWVVGMEWTNSVGDSKSEKCYPPRPES